MQHSFLFTTAEGKTLDYDAVAFFTFVDEDGELKIIDCRDFTDPKQRGAFYDEALKVLAKGALAT